MTPDEYTNAMKRLDFWKVRLNDHIVKWFAASIPDCLCEEGYPCR